MLSPSRGAPSPVSHDTPARVCVTRNHQDTTPPSYNPRAIVLHLSPPNVTEILAARHASRVSEKIYYKVAH